MATVTHERVRTGRGWEVLLLILAVGLGVLAYVEVGIALNDQVPTNLVAQAAAFTGLAIGMHLLVRWKAPYADPVILPCAVALTGIGLAMIYRINLTYSEIVAANPARNLPTDIAFKQLIWMVVGMGAATAVVLLFRDHRTLKRYSYLFLVAGLFLLLMPLIPGLGRTINGSRIWIIVGPFSFQPGEIAKICLAIFFAAYLVEQRDNLALAGRKILGIQLPRLRDLSPILVAWAVAIFVLVFERDLGTSLLFFGFFVAMLYVATERISWVLIGLLLFTAAAVLAFFMFDHVAARVDVWLNALEPAVYNRSPGGSGQVVQGLFGMASGGLMGTGWGHGYPQLVPYSYSDFMFTSLGEELGLTGLLAILAIYLILTQRGIRTGMGVRDGFGKLLCAGLAFVIAFQVFVVVGGVTRLIPLTGLTLPFMAYGGSSLLSNWIIVGILIRISNGAREPAVTTGSLLARVPGEVGLVGEDSEEDGVPGIGAVGVVPGAGGGSPADPGAHPGAMVPPEPPTEVVDRQ